MNRIEQKFRELKTKNKKAFIAYIMAGDPNLKTTYELVLELERRGVDIMELGVPFSDPIADGPTIQKAGLRALRNKVDLKDILNLVKQLRKRTELPLVLMSYLNLIYCYGIERLIKEARDKGVDGMIVPDLIPEEAEDLLKIAKANEFSTIFLASPTSTPERIKKIAEASTGFIYYVSLTGVTGTRDKLPAGLREAVLKIKEITPKPVCVGFGISQRKQVEEILKFSDGIVVGSAIVEIIERNINKPDLVKKVGIFVNRLSG
ncbi:MAG: tryptophan synthase subunit alpha [Candidatus Omnitrophica bacterium]|nr:tryptophan synthase subunit alpha [Candidatus Omnitrophota bacterium]MCM8798237.1 tryptophan synthase subunit alpha [Candidatus Omnitrophota bacterium]